MLYIGGVEPPTYDLTPILNAVNQTSGRLTVCCRKAEWKRFSSIYQDLISDRIEIVHLAGDELKELYERSDLMIMLRNPNPYLDFAVPVKIFESIGYETPIITTGNSEAGRIVRANGLGWVTSFSRHLTCWLDLRETEQNCRTSPTSYGKESTFILGKPGQLKFVKK